MSLALKHTFNNNIELYSGDTLLFRYVYMPQHDAYESPRPYFHPLRTLDGATVTGYRPHDHRWHVGLSMTTAWLSGQNFWGGATYVHPGQYVPMNNNGQQQHRAWLEMTCNDTRCNMIEQVAWITSEDEAWLDETRTIGVSHVDTAKGVWVLDFNTQLRNLSGKALEFGSPTTLGRPKAGYGGLSWRGSRDMTHGKIMIDGTEDANGDEADVIGSAGQWCAISSPLDERDGHATMLFIDRPTNPRYPNKWFVRVGQFAAVTFSFMFDEVYTLADGATLSLAYKIAVIDGAWSRDDIAAFLANTLQEGNSM